MLLNKSGVDDIEEPVEGPLQDLDVAGMAWWNGLSEADRRYWCLAAMTAVPAEAWKYFRLVTAPRRSVKVNHCD
ncbi:hypothetical protein [Hydrogenophaga sp. NFH-34]|uniref:hypothetical protein n=1 Tax=Hydrogenophaga sp. NFH-34 TaxID=2744446 RepID=UPI001F2DEB5D|nr:hypothetical protein [Hydrogenophaga sp. NFH-34]